ncbi:MAG: hypothetical protein IPK26_26305 [Planctomycetes bacterium]|nr:hypothetical protein [Planctomycetota bacterium]
MADSLASPSVLTVDHPWTENPQAGDILVVGLIPAHWESGDMSLVGQHREARALAVHVVLRSQDVTVGTYGELGWKATRGIANEPSNFSVANVDLNATHLQKQLRDNARGMRHRLRWRGLFPGIGFELESISISGTGLGSGDVSGTTT